MRSSQVQGVRHRGRGGGGCAAVAISQRARLSTPQREDCSWRDLARLILSVLSNLVPATSRRAGRSRGIERTRHQRGVLRNDRYSSVDLGPRAAGAAGRDRGACQRNASAITTPTDPGKYKVLNFAAPDLGRRVWRQCRDCCLPRHVTRRADGPLLQRARSGTVRVVRRRRTLSLLSRRPLPRRSLGEGGSRRVGRRPFDLDAPLEAAGDRAPRSTRSRSHLRHPATSRSAPCRPPAP